MTWESHYADLKASYAAAVLQLYRYWQRTGTETSGTEQGTVQLTHINMLPDFWWRYKSNYMEKGQPFQRMIVEHWGIHRQNRNLGLKLTPYRNISSKWIMNFNAKCKTINPLEGNIGEKLWVARLGKEFLSLTLNAQSIKGKINKSDFIKIEKFCFVNTPLMGFWKKD